MARWFTGNDGFAGELGHMIVKRNNGRICGCGRTGCLEAYCSATGVARTAREFLELRTEPSELRNLQIDDITSKEVYDAAMAGDKLAKEIFQYTGTILGQAFADMIAFSSPQAIILFGGLAKSGELLLKPVTEAMNKAVVSIFRGKTKVILSELRESDAAAPVHPPSVGKPNTAQTSIHRPLKPIFRLQQKPIESLFGFHYGFGLLRVLEPDAIRLRYC